MRFYGIRTAFNYALITKNKKDLDRFKKNVLYPVVKLKGVETEFGKYYMFTDKEKNVMVTDNAVVHRDLCERYEGKTIKIDLCEV